MSQEQPHRPVTYKDVFGDVMQGEAADQAVTMEDAALMQSAEMLGFGRTSKGGPACLMQSAADKNVHDHVVDPGSHSDAADRGFGIHETVVDGKVYRQEFVGQQTVSEETTFVPTLAEIAGTQGITIGEALEEAAQNEPEKVVDMDTARAIQSAESHATGIPFGLKGGLGATAQSAARKNLDRGEHITLSNVLHDAAETMLVDKVVTQGDVEKVKQVVAGKEEGSAIVSALQGAVDANMTADRYIQAHQKGQHHSPQRLTAQEEPAPNAACLQNQIPHAHAD